VLGNEQQRAIYRIFIVSNVDQIWYYFAVEEEKILQRIYLDNFKSLVDFSLPPKKDPVSLSSFSCLVGLNGSGKSTVLQAFDFLAQLPQGNIDDWLEKRKWKAEELTTKNSKKFIIAFEIVLHFQGKEGVWKGAYNIRTKRCTSETIFEDGKRILSVNEGKLSLFSAENKSPISVKELIYQGSILSVYNLDEKKYPAVKAVREFSNGMKSLELLNPQLIKSRSRSAEDVGFGGEKLTAFYHSLTADVKDIIQTELQTFYPRVQKIVSSSLRAGWKTLTVEESFETETKGNLETETIHLNDGMLRILTIITQMQTSHTCLLLDEIENGINPELVEQLMDYLVKGKKQVMVTTHSPMVLNYLDDDIATKGVFLIYRTAAGHTRCARFFNSTLAKNKLSLLGPGEVYVGTSLDEIAQELEVQYS
jgi:predicted ATPase